MVWRAKHLVASKALADTNGSTKWLGGRMGKLRPRGASDLPKSQSEGSGARPSLLTPRRVRVWSRGW